MNEIGQESLQEKEKKTLLTKLLQGVKGCQSRFGSRSELATEDVLEVRKLCYAYEDIFLHGLRKGPIPNNNSNSTGGGSRNFWQVPALLRSNEPATFWPLIKYQLSKHEAERFLLLNSVRTDLGRAKSWLRASLNEHNLERFILIILGFKDLHLFYESWAFLRDPELSSILPQTAAGLGSVLFALFVDNPNLDIVTRVIDKTNSEPIAESNLPEMAEVAEQVLNTSTSQTSELATRHQENSSTIGSTTTNTTTTNVKPITKKVKKSKKVPTRVISFEYSESPSSIINTNRSNSSTPISSPPSTSIVQSSSETITQASSPATATKIIKTPSPFVQTATASSNNNNVINKSTTTCSKKESTIPNPNPNVKVIVQEDNGNGNNANIGTKQIGRLKSPKNQNIESLIKSPDSLSIYSDCSDLVDDVSLSGVSPSQRLKPVFSDNSGNTGVYPEELIPVPNYEQNRNSTSNTEENDRDRNESNNNENDYTDNDNDGDTESHVFEPEKYFTPTRSLNLNQSSRRTSFTESIDQQSNIEERFQKLKAVLDHEVEIVSRLKDEQRGHFDQIKLFEAKTDSLKKENEILRHQLKKYVGAIQLLKSDGRFISFDENNENTTTTCATQGEDATNESLEYERKLIAVAEMHGELLEFNAHLQRILKRKTAAIVRLRQQLIDLRGPFSSSGGSGGDDLLLEDDECDNMSINSSINDTQGSIASSASTIRPRNPLNFSNERILINIWIPSVFLTGSTNDLHHVYQVFIRIKDTEWNIFRRYSQFYTLNKELKKKYPTLGSLYFPPKKHLGNKDARFVDERKRKLQEYLRNVINFIMESNTVLVHHPDKNLLISIIPFFGESTQSEMQQKQRNRERNRSRNIFFRHQSNSPSLQSSSSLFHTNSLSGPQYTGL